MRGNIKDVIQPSEGEWEEWQNSARFTMPLTPDEDDTVCDGDINITLDDDDDNDDDDNEEESDRHRNTVIRAVDIEAEY